MAPTSMMQCTRCLGDDFIRKGKRGIRQRYQCKSCKKYCQDSYCYQLYDPKDDLKIRILNAESVGIRSMSRILGYSSGTVIRRMLYLASKVTVPVYNESNQVYEVDELWTFVGKNKPAYYSWISYAINRTSRCVIGVVFGSRNSENLHKIIDKLKGYSPKKIITDGLAAYPNLVHPIPHDTSRYSNNRIERSNLTLRTHLKRLNRETICFSKSQKMLEASVLLYLDYRYWCLKME